MKAPLPKDETALLADLKGQAILDTAPESAYDDLTRLAPHICGTPIALVSLVDSDRQWFKSKVGIEAAETPRDQAFCAHAILEPDILIVPDATAMVVSTFCLVILFILFSFARGYLFSFALGLRVAAPGIFLNQVLRALRPHEVLILLVTGLVPPLLTASVCCSEGLNAPVTSTAVPLATRRALSYLVVGLFLVSVPASVLTCL